MKLETYIWEFLVEGNVLTDCMYYIIKFLLNSIFDTMIISAKHSIHPTYSMNFLVLWYHQLIFCIMRSTSFLGMIHKSYPIWRAYTLTVTSIPIWILYLPSSVQWRTGGWHTEVGVIWSQHQRMLQKWKYCGFYRHNRIW